MKTHLLMIADKGPLPHMTKCGLNGSIYGMMTGEMSVIGTENIVDVTDNPGKVTCLKCSSSSRRGGPRPGFGGKQPGAGRKAGPVTDRPVAVVLDPETARKLDAQRGEVSRAEFVRQLILKQS